MFLKNNRELAVKNVSLATVIEVTTSAIATRLDGKEKREVEFRLADYSALDYATPRRSIRRRARPSSVRSCWRGLEWTAISLTSR